MAGAGILALSACGGDDAPPANISGPTPTPSPAPSPTPSPTPPSTGGTQVLTSDILYGQGAVVGGEVDLLLDHYAPDEECSTNRPTVFFVHGGGFTGGSKSNRNAVQVAPEVTARGFNFVSIDYRVDPQDPLPSQPFVDVLEDIAAEVGTGTTDPDFDPNDTRRDAIAAAFEDTVTALNFLEANQDDLCIDTNRLVFWGSSAGAFTVLHVAYSLNQFGIQRPEPLAVIDYWGALFRDSDLEVGEKPFLVIHAKGDATVEYVQAQELTNRADVVAVPYAFYTINGGAHGFDGAGIYTLTVEDQTLLERTLDFAEASLTNQAPIYGRFEITP